MALADSNTYVEPTAGTSLNTARSQFNNTVRSILTNFRSTEAPTAVNLVATGDQIGPQDGMLFVHETTGALYVYDSINVKNAPIGGNFTRTGIGTRIENGIAALTANIATYEIGELVSTVSASGSLASNARVYMKTANTGTMSDFIDIGIPPYMTITPGSSPAFVVSGTGSMTAYDYIAGRKITTPSLYVTTSMGINTTSPTEDLHIVGGNMLVEDNYKLKLGTGKDSSLYFSGSHSYFDMTAGNLYLRDTSTTRFTFERTSGDFIATGDITAANSILADSAKLKLGTGADASLYFNGSHSYFDMTGGNLYLRDTSTTRFTFARTTGTFTATGDVTAYSDERLKSNIKTIDNAIDKVIQLRGVSFNKDGVANIGVIAQEVEKIIPEVVHTMDNKEQIKSVAYGNIVGLLIEAIKEQQLQIDKLTYLVKGQ